MPTEERALQTKRLVIAIDPIENNRTVSICGEPKKDPPPCRVARMSKIVCTISNTPNDTTKSPLRSRPLLLRGLYTPFSITSVTVAVVKMETKKTNGDGYTTLTQTAVYAPIATRLPCARLNIFVTEIWSTSATVSNR
jgi:hypothetical protein